MKRTKITLKNDMTGETVSVLASDDNGNLSMSKRQYRAAYKKLKINRLSSIVCATDGINGPVIVYGDDGFSGHAIIY